MLVPAGGQEAVDLIVKGTEGNIAAKTVTSDFERLMKRAVVRKWSKFGQAIVKHMG